MCIKTQTDDYTFFLFLFFFLNLLPDQFISSLHNHRQNVLTRFFPSTTFPPFLILSHLLIIYLIISSTVPSGQTMKHQTDSYIWPHHADILVRVWVCVRACVLSVLMHWWFIAVYYDYDSVKSNLALNTWREHVNTGFKFFLRKRKGKN